MTCKLKLQNKGLYLNNWGAYLCLIRLALAFPYICLSICLKYRKFKKVVLGVLEKVTPSNFFGRILRNEALVYNSYFFPEQAFYGNYSTLDSHTNTVISHAFAYCQDGVENHNKVYSIPPASHSFRTFHLLPPVALPTPFSPGLPLPSSHKQKATATRLFLFRRGSKNRVFENSGFHCIAD